MKFRDQFALLDIDLEENRGSYLYRFLPIATVLLFASTVFHLSVKSSLLAAKTMHNDLLYLASAMGVAFFSAYIFFIAGSLLIKQYSPKQQK